MLRIALIVSELAKLFKTIFKTKRFNVNFCKKLFIPINKTGTVFFLFTFFVASLALFAQISDSNSQRPNILFISVDDLKPELGAYGNSKIISPTIDKLASEGTLFFNAHVQQAVCGPSRASLLTGLRPDNTQVWELFTQMREVNPNTLTLPEYLRKNGYETAGSGKVFDLSCVDDKADEPSWSIPFKKATGERWLLNSENVATEAPDLPDSAFIDYKIADEGLKLLDKISKGDKPFFLAVGFKKPHLPFVAPKKYWDLYNREDIEIAAVQEHPKSIPKYAFQPSWELRSGYVNIPKEDPLPVEMQKKLIQGYYACISHVDDQVKRLLDRLDSLKLRDNTIVVLWGDHGYHLGDHQMWCKHTNFEQSARTALIISAPGYKQNNKTYSVNELIDIFPTLCELTGIEIPKNLDGKSLVPILKDGRAKVKKFAVTQYNRNTMDFSGNAGKNIQLQGYSLRTERYRYTEWIKDMVKSHDSYYLEENVYGNELYDYKTDPLERVNLVSDKNYENILNEMKQLMKEYFINQKRY